MKHAQTHRILTELDHVRLRNLIHRHRDSSASPDLVDAIEDMLDEASLVPSSQVPPDVVTMHSTVVLHDSASGQRSTLTVCYPPDAEPDKGFLSVLSPVGSNLLGMHVGAIARWPTPSGEPRAAEIVAILFQPEAAGDFTM